MGLASFVRISVSISVIIVFFQFLFVFQTRNPIGKFHLSPSNALLWTINPSRYSAFQFSRNFSKFGAFTYFSFENIARVAFGISCAIRATNWVKSSLLAFQYSFIQNSANFVFATFALLPLAIPSQDSAYGGFIRTNIFLPSAMAFRSLSGILFVRV